MWNNIWEQIFSNREWGRYPSESVIRFVALNFYRHLNRAELRFLDLGCGPGINAWYLAREGFSVHGIDGSPTAIVKAQKRFAEESLRGVFEVGDMTSLPYSDGYFDAVIDGYAMCTNDRDSHSKILAEVHRVLKPGALLYSIFPDVECWGFGTGEVIDDYIGKNEKVGPFANQGTIYHFDESEIRRQFRLFNIASLEMEKRTVEGRKHWLAEWILWARRQ